MNKIIKLLYHVEGEPIVSLPGQMDVQQGSVLDSFRFIYTAVDVTTEEVLKSTKL